MENGKKEWIVIGYETDMGDPVFVNVADDTYLSIQLSVVRKRGNPIHIGNMDEIIKHIIRKSFETGAK